MSRAALTLAAAVVVAGQGLAAQPRTDWKAVEADAIRTLQQYIRIDTSNPPGDVTKAADFLVAVLQRYWCARRDSNPQALSGRNF